MHGLISATLLLTTAVLATTTAVASPPSVQRFDDRAAFQRELAAIFGADARPTRLATAALQSLGAGTRMFVVTAAFGRFAAMSSDEARGVFFVRADGGVFCYSDSGCPDGADEDAEDPREGEEPGYHAVVDMAALTLVGQGDHVIIPLGKPSEIGLIVGRSAGDSVPESYRLIRVTRDKIVLRRPILRDARFEDVDGDGQLDGIITHNGIGTVGQFGVWRDVVLGDGRGHFTRNRTRAIGFMQAELTRWLAELDKGPSSFEDADSVGPDELVSPILSAYATAAAGRLAAPSLSDLARRWVAALPRALALEPDAEDSRMRHAQALLTCLGRSVPSLTRVTACANQVGVDP
jgi:hypothetical protein